MQPSFLFITADDMNYDSLGVTGCEVPDISPHIDRLASEGLRFVNAHVNIAVCQPSRSVLMTGRYPHRNGAMGFEPIDLDVPTLQEHLHQAGYYNGIIGKENHLAPRHKFCWDEYISTHNKPNGWGRDPGKYYEHTKAFLEAAKNAGKPFFLMANSHDPHRPFAHSEQEEARWGRHLPMPRRYNPEEVEVPGFLPDITDVRREVAQYFASVKRCDESVGQILRALDESGLAGNTVVMFLSDNGMAFPFAKTNCYLASTKTPWIVRWPGHIEPGTVDSTHFVSGIDFMPTVLEIAGLPQVGGVDGTSFLPLLLGQEQENRDDVFTMFNTTAAKQTYPMRCIQNRRLGYIFNLWSDEERVFRNESQSGLSFRAMQEAAKTDAGIAARVKLFQYRVKEELYDFERDPNALHNLIGDPAYQGEVVAMRRRLLQKMIASEDPITEEFRRQTGV